MLLLCKSLRKFPGDTWTNEKLNFKAGIFIQQLVLRMSTMTSNSTNSTRATNCAFVSHLSNISLKVVGVVVDMLDPVKKMMKVQI